MAWYLNVVGDGRIVHRWWVWGGGVGGRATASGIGKPHRQPHRRPHTRVRARATAANAPLQGLRVRAHAPEAARDHEGPLGLLRLDGRREVKEGQSALIDLRAWGMGRVLAVRVCWGGGATDARLGGSACARVHTRECPVVHHKADETHTDDGHPTKFARTSLRTWNAPSQEMTSRLTGHTRCASWECCAGVGVRAHAADALRHVSMPCRSCCTGSMSGVGWQA
jgi:hypothetical protein